MILSRLKLAIGELLGKKKMSFCRRYKNSAIILVDFDSSRTILWMMINKTSNKTFNRFDNKMKNKRPKEFNNHALGLVRSAYRLRMRIKSLNPKPI